MNQRKLSQSSPLREKRSCRGTGRGIDGHWPRRAAILLFLTTLGLPLALPSAAAAVCGFSQDADMRTPSAEATTFDTAPGWTMNSSHAYVRWHISTSPGRHAGADGLSHSPPFRLYYGDGNVTSSPTYSTRGEPNFGVATSPPIYVPKGSTNLMLHFNAKYEVEARDPLLYDQMTVELSTDDGATWNALCRVGPTLAPGGHLTQTVCSNGTPEGAFPCPRGASGETEPMWESRQISIEGTGANTPMRVRFLFSTGDALENDAMGWMIDDVELSYADPVAPPPQVPIMTGGMLGVLVMALALIGSLSFRKDRE